MRTLIDAFNSGACHLYLPIISAQHHTVNVPHTFTAAVTGTKPISEHFAIMIKNLNPPIRFFNFAYLSGLLNEHVNFPSYTPRNPH